jgi:transposase-like protein
MNRRQTIPKHLRYTINDFNRQFPDDNACFEHLREQRFPDGIAYCATCKQERQHHRIKARPVYACDECLTQISPMAGTIFEHTSTSLRLWYYAMYLMASTRCGISAKQIQRETGVTYKTAWRMFKQIRSLLSESGMQLEGSAVEIDEMYFGGKRKGGGGVCAEIAENRTRPWSWEWWSARGASLPRLCPMPAEQACSAT